MNILSFSIHNNLLGKIIKLFINNIFVLIKWTLPLFVSALRSLIFILFLSLSFLFLDDIILAFFAYRSSPIGIQIKILLFYADGNI